MVYMRIAMLVSSRSIANSIRHLPLDCRQSVWVLGEQRMQADGVCCWRKAYSFANGQQVANDINVYMYLGSIPACACPSD
jgi:hypothetical protein